MNFISVVTPCKNEVRNIGTIYRGVVKALYICGYGENESYEHIFIDNCSTDGTIDDLRLLAEQDKCVKVILNVKDFGAIRSPIHGFFQARGDAVIQIAADLQEPPEVIPEFLEKWKKGFKIVIGVHRNSTGRIRDLYYRMLGLVPGFNGFGLYDREVVEALRRPWTSSSFFRAAVLRTGYEWATVQYNHALRNSGYSKYNFFNLLPPIILGICDKLRIPFPIVGPVTEKERVNF